MSIYVVKMLRVLVCTEAADHAAALPYVVIVV